MEMPVFTGLPVEGQLIIIASLSFPIQLTNCSWAREEPQRGRGKMSPGCSPVNSLASIISVSNTSTASMGSSAASSELRYRRATFRVNSSIVIIVASFTLGILGSEFISESASWEDGRYIAQTMVGARTGGQDNGRCGGGPAP